MSADKQAVREMNMALAEYEASAGYSQIPDVDTLMQILANAGYNTVNWQCLTFGYEVYWFKNDNRMILYNSSTAAIEYPEEYVGTKVMVTPENGFFMYNYNHVIAQQFDLSLSSSAKGDDGKYHGSTSFASVVTSEPTGSMKSNQAANISAIQSIVSNDSVKTAIASTEGKTSASGDIYMYASREIVSSNGNAFASLQVASVGTEANPVKLKSNGDLKENLYYISTVTEGATQAEIETAKAAAGSYVYTLFDQISTGKIDASATIILEAGTEINVSACEWAPCKTFCGYFGTTDASKPIVIEGARLSPATGYSQTVSMTGSGSKYFITGFFGTVYGKTTIENVIFKDLSINAPASDYELTESDRNNNKINTRNTVGIIGGITDGFETGKYGVAADVTLKNIVVENSCTVTGAGCAGGLVGYIGSVNSNAKEEDGTNLKGNIVIEGCKVYDNVVSLDKNSNPDYKSVGGIIGFTCRVDKDTKIQINNCIVDCTLTSDSNCGAIAGAFQNTPTVVINGGDYSKAVVNGANRSGSVAGYIDGGDIRFGATLPTLNSLPHTFKTANATEWVIYSDKAPAAKS